MAGNEEYQDDTSILADTVLWRRIPPQHFHKETNGKIRPASAAFDDHPNGTPMSVVIASESTVEQVLAGHPDFALVKIFARDARDLGLGIRRMEILEQPGHAEIFGPKSKPIKRALAKASTWVVAPK